MLLAAAVALAGPPDKLPADCWLATYVDFEALRKTAVYGKVAGAVEELVRDELGYEGLMEGAGFRLDPDLASFTAGLGRREGASGFRFYLVVRGRIDAAKLAASHADEPYKSARRGRMTVFWVGEDPSNMRYALTDDGAFLLADPGSAIDDLAAALGNGEARPLGDTGGAHVRTVFTQTPDVHDAAFHDPLCAALAGVRSAAVTWVAGDGVDIALTAEAEDDRGAERLVSFLRGGLGATRFRDRVELERGGATVRGSCRLGTADCLALMGVPAEASGAAVVEGAPELEGDGRLLRLALRGQVNDLEVSPDGRYVFVDRALHDDVLLDAELRVVAKSPETYGRMAFSADGRTAIWDAPGAVEVRRIPDLTKLHEVEGTGSGAWAVLPVPGKASLLIVDWGRIRVFHPDPPRMGVPGLPRLPRVAAATIDPKTGLLLMIEDSRLEVFDPASMTSACTLKLPSGVTAITAAGGRAWAGTHDAAILPVDIAERKVLDAVRVADAGEVKLALSASGRTLVAIAERFVDRDHHPMTARIYRVEEGALREIRAARFDAPGATNAVVILEAAETVLLAGTESLLWRYGAGD